ncbi:MAG: hypothetical protein CMJ86_05170, partial [Planctomycetes bacterium]|nr:hypothetical protein [Planctomycetota bacterium]
MKPDYSRRRAILLLVVWLLMAAHVVHWKLAGRTLAPLELNEVMHTLELGVVTAGFLFMLLVLGSVLVFGRFFCSWGCHILALEDGSAWLLNRAGIKARPVRSRVLAWVPFGALLYMFVWPQVKRVLEGREAPKLHVLADGEGWASFVTSDFARNLPGPGMALVTFVVVGLVMVYFLGSRSFCRYGCPYGALFALADRMAPGRIVASKSCTACGLCTAACQSGIAVHEELQRFGTVVNSACLRDLDCVSACPDGAVRFGWAAPPVVRFWNRNYWAQRPRVRFHLSPWEEVVALLLFFLGLGISRGLYGLVPFLLSLGIGAMTAWVGVLSLRLVQRPAVKLGNVQLKLNGKLTKGGRRFALGALMAG